MRRWLTVLALAFVAFCGSRAVALETCNAWTFPETADDGFRPATVVGPPGTQAHFHDGGKACPSAACPRRAYLIPGDRVIVSTVTEGWACAFYGGSKHEEVGWLAAAQLGRGRADGNPPLDAWLGNWTAGRDSIDIQKGGGAGTVAAEGFALWGAGPAPRTGEFTGIATPAGNVAVFDDDECQVRTTLVAGWLIAVDNGKCGGMSVYFNGVYRKQAAPKSR